MITKDIVAALAKRRETEMKPEGNFGKPDIKTAVKIERADL